MQRRLTWIILILLTTHPGASAAEIAPVEAEVIIAGGSTAALAAAFAAADAGAKTVLLEPTDWIGGQLTSSGVPAVDEAWHQIKDNGHGQPLPVAQIARDPRNMTPWFRDALLAIGNPGRGWVSRFCFEPKQLLQEHLEPEAKRLSDQLTIYHDTVVKRLRREGTTIVSLTAVQRFPRVGSGYDRLPSQDLPDWYDEEASARFEKRVWQFQPPAGKSAIFIDATEWGELLALSGTRYLVGVDEEDGALETNDTCGQATVFGFVQELCDDAIEDPAPPAAAEGMGWGKYADREDAWSRVWTYRRLKGDQSGPGIGDLSLQNWGYSRESGDGGNDYPFGYLFLTRAKTEQQVGDWQGGVDLDVMAAAEQRALAWHHWFKHQAQAPFSPDQIRLRPDVLGTEHGLSKLPYIRDTRRAIGLDGFVLKLEDLVGKQGDATGFRFPDRIAIGCYPADVHPLDTCRYPSHTVEHYDTRPFYIPYRALTHESLTNLLTAGKTMAQTFMANSATRLHPIEWSTGTAAGTIAALAYERQTSLHELAKDLPAVQAAVAKQTPIEWQLN